MNRSPSFALFLGSLLFGWVFAVLPLPELLSPARPYLLGLLLCYWILETPQRVGLGSAFLIGLFADVVSGTLFGEQGLRLVILTFLVQRFRARLRFFPLWQQALAVLALLSNDRVIALLIHLLSGDGGLPWLSMLSPVLAMALWPWLFLLLDSLRLRSRERH